LLTKHGADPERTADQGGSALYCAVKKGNADVATYLLEGCQSSLFNNSSKGTPVHAAAASESSVLAATVLQILRKVCGADESSRHVVLAVSV
jgi:ankyrin repeat protein